VYSTDQPIQIPYAHENFRFLSPRAFRARYALLVRNAGFRPISVLCVLSPRVLYHYERLQVGTRRRAGLQFHGFQNVTDQLPLDHPQARPVGNNRLEMELADPNNPSCRFPVLSGLWDHGNLNAAIPSEVLSHPRLSCSVFQRHQFSAWHVRFAAPIEPGEAHWLQWELEVLGVGEPLEEGLYGPVVFHEIASPIDVRRRVVEKLRNALQDVFRARDSLPASSPDYQQRSDRLSLHETVLNDLVRVFGLSQERRVDLQYYELTIETGDPRKQFLLSIIPQGDIYLRPGSPRIGHHEELDRGRIGEPVYEWQAGSILEPAHPWKNTGFSLRLGLGCKRGFFRDTRMRLYREEADR
jgi:hypothetical protein